MTDCKEEGADHPPNLHDTPHDFREWTAAELARVERLATSRKNPLYAWEAIRICCLRSTPFPEWIRKYLGSVAINLAALVQQCGVDTGIDVQLPDKKQVKRGRRLSTAEAANASAWALEIVSHGKNAFADLTRDIDAMNDAIEIELADRFPDAISMDEAKRSIAERRSLADPNTKDGKRSARRRIQKGRRLRSILNP